MQAELYKAMSVLMQTDIMTLIVPLVAGRLSELRQCHLNVQPNNYKTELASMEPW